MRNILVLASTFPTFVEEDYTPPFVYELCRGIFSLNSYKLFVLTPYKKNTKLREEKSGIIIIRFKYLFTSLCDGAMLTNLKRNRLLWLEVPFFFLFYIINVIKIIKREKIECIHAHWIIPQGFIAVFVKKVFYKNLKIVVTSHGADIFSLRGWLAKKIKRYILENIDYLTMVSSASKNEIDGLGVRRCPRYQVIPMGVDTQAFCPERRSEDLKKRCGINGTFLLFVGRLDEKKGLRYLIESMPEVVRAYPRAKLVIIGGGPEENNLKIYSQKMRLLDENIIFLGPIKNNDLPPFYATSDIFISPNVVAANKDSDGLPVVIIEALLSKTCVIASDLPALSDIILNNKTGLTVNVKDPKIFSSAIVNLIQNGEKRKILAESGYELAKKNFSLHSVSSRYNSIYNALI